MVIASLSANRPLVIDSMDMFRGFQGEGASCRAAESKGPRGVPFLGPNATSLVDSWWFLSGPQKWLVHSERGLRLDELLLKRLKIG